MVEIILNPHWKIKKGHREREIFIMFFICSDEKKVLSKQSRFMTNKKLYQVNYIIILKLMNETQENIILVEMSNKIIILNYNKPLTIQQIGNRNI